MAAIALPGVLPGVLDTHSNAARRTVNRLSLYRPVSLNAKEMDTLKAALAQLLPKDDIGPGAVEAGVHVYIDKALAGSYKSLRPAYHQLLSMVEKAGGNSFSALPTDRQAAVLKQLEAGKAPGLSAAERATAAASFTMLLTHMREGMFADPMYGGNHGQAGWELIGYPGVTLVWTAKDQEIGTKVRASHKTAKTFGGSPYNGPAAVI